MKKNKKKYYSKYNNGNKNTNKSVTASTAVSTSSDSAIDTATKIIASSYTSFGSLSSKTAQSYTYKGRKNQTEYPEFVQMCKYTQKELIELLPNKLGEAGYADVIVGDGYIYAKGTVPVLLTAHMDTVHKTSVKDFYEYIDTNGNHVLSSPQGIGGDDRCGIYMILDIIKEHKCSVLFCEDEENGGIGSRKFCRTEYIKDLEDLKYLIELDRANEKDAVFYDCENPDFTKFIEDNTGFKETYGSFSDISNLAPECMVAAVNLSCGYYHAHTLGEEVVVEEMLHTIEVVKKLLTVECEQFEYIEAEYNYGYNYGYGYHGGYGYGYGYSKGYSKGYSSYYYDDDDDWNPPSMKKNTDSTVKGKYDWYEEDPVVILYVTFYEGVTLKETQESYCATTEEGAWLKFFKENPDTCWNYVMDYEFDYM